MSWTPISIEQLKEALPLICDSETVHEGCRDGWSLQNPLWGHGAVVSVLVHNLFGGHITASAIAQPKKWEGVRHYRNVLPDGTTADFTACQFGNAFPVLKGEKRITNSLVHLRIKKSRRYKLLVFRLLQKLYGANAEGVQSPIFYDRIYQACFDAAMDSPCQKMKFGCVITQGTAILHRGCNKTIEPLKGLCDPACVRLSTKSRTESMIGSCGHAEEFALWDVARINFRLNECNLYVAGFYPNGLPWIKRTAEHTCLRCAVQMYHARIGKIFVPVSNHQEGQLFTHAPCEWRALTAEEAVRTALAYAMGEKTV